MFAITYLSTADRKRLVELKDLILRQQTDEERAKLIAEQADVESRRKRLSELEVDECQALKDQLYQQYSKLLKIGRVMQGRQFFIMLQSVDIRLAYLYNTNRLDEQNAKKDEVLADNAVKERRKNDARALKLPDGKFSSRWSISLGDDD